MISVAILLFAVVAVRSEVTKCYQCNSAVPTESWCENPTEDKLTRCTGAGSHAYQESGGPIKEMDIAVGCRKTLQYVESDWFKSNGSRIGERTIRECAYTGQNVDGQKRTGNKGIRMFYYQCDDMDGCNGGTVLTLSMTAFTAAVALLLGA